MRNEVVAIDRASKATGGGYYRTCTRSMHYSYSSLLVLAREREDVREDSLAGLGQMDGRSIMHGQGKGQRQ